MYRLVVDTNVIVSAVIGTGKPRQFLLEGLLGGKYALVTSDAIISEMREVLGRPKSLFCRMLGVENSALTN